jgi:hypothetical protein
MFGGLGTKKQGDVGLAHAIAHFASLGATVSIPLTDSQDYDLVVDAEGRLMRVQVKTTRFRNANGIYTAQLATNGGNQSWTGVVKHFDPAKVDCLFVLTEAGTRYVIPAVDVSCRWTISLGKKYARFVV